MTVRRRGVALLPPLLAGLVAAVAVETSAGLLLYADDGLLPALTTILTIEVGALGLGLGIGSLSRDGTVVDQIRGRWLFCLIAFALAAVLSAGLSFMGDLPGTWLGQGVGLGFLGGLPLFAIGSLLGTMGRPDDLGRSSLPLVAAPSVLGAAVGFLLAGSILLPNAAPYTLYLSCLVILSGGALLQGRILDGRPSVEVLETVSGSTGELRLEKRATVNPRGEMKVLLEGGRIRGGEDSGGNPGRDWEAAVLEGLSQEDLRPGSLLYLGGGSGTLVRLLSHRFPQTRIQVVERSSELVALARSRFAKWDGWEEVDLQVGELLAPSPGVETSFSVIVIDCGALPTIGGEPFLEESHWRFLAGHLEVGGVLLMGGLRVQEGDAAPPSWEVVGNGRRWFENVSLYHADPIPAERKLPHEGWGGTEVLLLFSSEGAVPWPPSLSAFRFFTAEQS